MSAAADVNPAWPNMYHRAVYTRSCRTPMSFTEWEAASIRHLLIAAAPFLALRVQVLTMKTVNL